MFYYFLFEFVNKQFFENCSSIIHWNRNGSIAQIHKLHISHMFAVRKHLYEETRVNASQIPILQYRNRNVHWIGIGIGIERENNFSNVFMNNQWFSCWNERVKILFISSTSPAIHYTPPSWIRWIKTFSNSMYTIIVRLKLEKHKSIRCFFISLLLPLVTYFTKYFCKRNEFFVFKIGTILICSNWLEALPFVFRYFNHSFFERQ